jgi:membrane-anchored protein YejM (alkaline phosphatase superfamily)
MYYPGCQPRTISALTSHVDLVPTMLELLGYTVPAEVHSQGRSLLNGQGHDFVVVSGWDESAIVDGDHVLVFSLKTHGIARFEVRDTFYELVDDEESVMVSKRPLALKVLRGFRGFLR